MRSDTVIVVHPILPLIIPPVQSFVPCYGLWRLASGNLPITYVGKVPDLSLFLANLALRTVGFMTHSEERKLPGSNILFLMTGWPTFTPYTEYCG